ncbi:unnamed protein product [Caenorhabditis angaria]|uniref:Uncharacterized protein n=1 Tax=Caenorhabditis angaria TaxID=860376 RepID=A0A9P1N3D7_9PELO|nr:unnamed protein product [Caenorhabditis angaria]
MSTNQPSYSVKDIILRYESEEEEFVRELESMMTHENVEEQEAENDLDGGPPILFWSMRSDRFRTENRRLKTRLIPQSPRTSKNVVQRMSAMFEHRGSSIFPRLRRVNRSNESIEVRNGARERLSTPPKENSMTSTDASAAGIPPIVRPELSDSEIDEQIFNEDEDDDDHRSRDTTRRCDSVRHSTSACTSPSSASSSRDPSEIMTTSRSSFLDLFGFRRRSTHIPQPTSSYAKTVSTKQVVKKRRKKVSEPQSGMYLDDDDRLPNKPPRPASYYRRDDSEDSDYLRQRKSTSFLNVNHGGGYGGYRENQIQHEKDNLEAEVEELKLRNQRLVEQLREKSQQQSKLQCQLHKVEMQMNTLSRRCAMSEAVDRLTLDERIERSATQSIKKIEERLRIFENQMQNAKLETANAHQMAMNSTCNERIAHQNCLEKLESVQREHMRVIHSSLMEMGIDEMSLKRRLENFPTYEALYAFTHSIVRRLNEAKWTIIEKTYEASRAQMDLISTQTSLLVTHAQMERLRISKGQKRVKRPASFHGNEYQDRIVQQNLSFYLPFKLQGSRVENMRRLARKKSPPNDRNIEEEFLKLFSYSKDFSTDPSPPEIHRRASNRIENMMREMNRGPIRRQPSVPVKGNVRRPISLVETEEKRYRRNEETRRSIKFIKTNSIDQHRDGLSTQDIPSGLNSPANTPIFSRRIIIPTKGNNYDHVAEGVPQRVRKLERAFSTESRNTVESNNMNNEPRRNVKLQRSQPVSRIKQPTVQLNRFRTLDGSNPAPVPPTTSHLHQPSSIQYRPRTLESSTPRHPNSPPPENGLSRIPQVTRQRSWFEKLKGIAK